MKTKRIDSLSELRGFKFLTTLVLELKKIESDDETIAFFIRAQKQRCLIMKVILTMHLNQLILRLHQTYKNLEEKVRIRLLIQS